MAKKDQTNAEIEEQDCVALAYKQARQMLEAGTAPPSIVMHFLQKGSPDNNQNRRKKEAEIEVLGAKATSLEGATGEADLYKDVLNAIKSYEYNPNEA